MDELTATCGCGATLSLKGFPPDATRHLFTEWASQHPDHAEGERPIDHWCPSESFGVYGGLRCQLAEGHASPHSNYLGRAIPVQWTSRPPAPPCRCDHSYETHAADTLRCRGIASYTGDRTAPPCDCIRYVPAGAS